MLWLSLFFTSYVSAQMCRVLSMQGGASFGSYEGGVLTAMVNLLPPTEVQYNAVVGISAGSLNSLLLAIFPMGQELNATQLIYNVYYNLDGAQDVYIDWKGGVIEGLTLRSGLYNNEPLRKTIAKYFTSLKRNITVGSCNIGTGEFMTWNETVGNANIQEAAICSSSIPGFFPMQSFQGNNYVDGGTIYSNDIFDAVKRCYAVTGNYSLITVDALACFGDKLNTAKSNLKSLEVKLRADEIRSYDSGLSELYYAMEAYPDVNFRYYIQPSVSLGKVPLNFTHAALMYNYDVGMKDAQNIINNKIFARQIINDWIAKNGGVNKRETIII
ncbi:unnamed protein product [Blepharisma stoltei]|uniref:PNPLA domain-containing protein n=1 Tax=Blepharisma stoltei TaxID=1481888 RepID=A0AAU9JVP8_9CILI|nr:unnamed protein product [Blepharisma stoltei]